MHTCITIKVIKTNFRAFPPKTLMVIRRMKMSRDMDGTENP